MTPKFKYDPQQHCLREVARMEEPTVSHFVTQHTAGDIFDSLSFEFEDAYRDYKQHIAFLRVIPCSPGSKWPEGELEEREDFAVIEGEACPRIHDIAFPITKPPRMYTQAEAMEIWEEAFYAGENGKRLDDYKKYFKTRFNVEL